MSSKKDKSKFKNEVKKILKEFSQVSDTKSATTDAFDDEDEEGVSSPEKAVESSPEKLGENSSKKLKDESPDKKKENKTEGADLMIAEEKEYDKVYFSDYVKLFRFSYGAWTMGLFLFQNIFC